jgi:hypothetical protein
VRETEITRALSSTPSEKKKTDWRTDSSFMVLGRGVSPHYHFHGAANTVWLVEKAFDSGLFSPEAQQLVARTIVRIWKETGSTHEAMDYAHAVLDLVDAARDTDKRGIDLSTLQDATTEALTRVEAGNATSPR